MKLKLGAMFLYVHPIIFHCLEINIGYECRVNINVAVEV